jgi:Fe-Mn family superoxide dismutase
MRTINSQKERGATTMLTEQRPTHTAKKFDLSGLAGISDHTLEVHFGLYEGYVKNANLLDEQIADLVRGGKASGADPHFAELTRRLGFEYNGVVLHEYYFSNLTKRAGAKPPSDLESALAEPFGDFEMWRKDFSAVGGMRGVGWAIAYYDPRLQRISNNWVTLHEVGNVAGFVPLLVMDVWEHAFMFDYKPSERGKYIEAFLANVDWNVVGNRLASARSVVPVT